MKTLLPRWGMATLAVVASLASCSGAQEQDSSAKQQDKASTWAAGDPATGYVLMDSKATAELDYWFTHQEHAGKTVYAWITRLSAQGRPTIEPVFDTRQVDELISRARVVGSKDRVTIQVDGRTVELPRGTRYLKEGETIRLVEFVNGGTGAKVPSLSAVVRGARGTRYMKPGDPVPRSEVLKQTLEYDFGIGAVTLEAGTRVTYHPHYTMKTPSGDVIPAIVEFPPMPVPKDAYASVTDVWGATTYRNASPGATEPWWPGFFVTPDEARARLAAQQAEQVRGLPPKLPAVEKGTAPVVRTKESRESAVDQRVAWVASRSRATGLSDAAPDAHAEARVEDQALVIRLARSLGLLEDARKPLEAFGQKYDEHVRRNGRNGRNGPQPFLLQNTYDPRNSSELGVRDARHDAGANAKIGLEAMAWMERAKDERFRGLVGGLAEGLLSLRDEASGLFRAAAKDEPGYGVIRTADQASLYGFCRRAAAFFQGADASLAKRLNEAADRVAAVMTGRLYDRTAGRFVRGATLAPDGTLTLDSGFDTEAILSVIRALGPEPLGARLGEPAASDRLMAMVRNEAGVLDAKATLVGIDVTQRPAGERLVFPAASAAYAETLEAMAAFHQVRHPQQADRYRAEAAGLLQATHDLMSRAFPEGVALPAALRARPDGTFRTAPGAPMGDGRISPYATADLATTIAVMLAERGLASAAPVDTSKDWTRVQNALVDAQVHEDHLRYRRLDGQPPSFLSAEEFDHLMKGSEDSKLVWLKNLTPDERTRWGVERIGDDLFKVGGEQADGRAALHVVNRTPAALIEVPSPIDVRPAMELQLIRGRPEFARHLTPMEWKDMAHEVWRVKDWFRSLTPGERQRREATKYGDSYVLNGAWASLPGDAEIRVVDGEPVSVVQSPQRVTPTARATDQWVASLEAMGLVSDLSGAAAPRDLTDGDWWSLETFEHLTLEDFKALNHKVRSEKQGDRRVFYLKDADGRETELASGRTLFLRQPDGSIALVTLGLKGLARATHERELDQASYAVLRLKGQPPIRFEAKTESQFHKKLAERGWHTEDRFIQEHQPTGAQRLVTRTETPPEVLQAVGEWHPFVVTELGTGRELGVLEFGQPALEERRGKIQQLERNVEELRRLIERATPGQPEDIRPESPQPQSQPAAPEAPQSPLPAAVKPVSVTRDVQLGSALLGLRIMKEADQELTAEGHPMTEADRAWMRRMLAVNTAKVDSAIGTAQDMATARALIAELNERLNRPDERGWNYPNPSGEPIQTSPARRELELGRASPQHTEEGSQDSRLKTQGTAQKSDVPVTRDVRLLGALEVLTALKAVDQRFTTEGRATTEADRVAMRQLLGEMKEQVDTSIGTARDMARARALLAELTAELVAQPEVTASTASPTTTPVAAPEPRSVERANSYQSLPPLASPVQQAQRPLILTRIVAEKGDGSKLNITLRTGRIAKHKLTPASQDPKSGVLLFTCSQGEMTAEAPRNMIIGSGGTATMRLPIEGNPRVTVVGDVFLDDSLNASGGMHGWDGKKDGATHTIAGKLTIFEYEFSPDISQPLKFKITSGGYEHVGGAGVVKDLKTGAIKTLTGK